MESTSASVEDVTRKVEAAAAAENPEGDPTDEPRAARIAQATRDFVLERLQKSLTHGAFEFTADLLRAIGYQARVTPYSQDGGIDVIAHHDPLGVEPPLLKVQCKHHTNSVGAPEIQQLVGAQGTGELSVFVTLSTYSRDAFAIERQRAGLRLLNGEDVVSLVLDNYPRLGARWRALIPSTSILVLDEPADAL